jgi:hypothetical protein
MKTYMRICTKVIVGNPQPDALESPDYVITQTLQTPRSVLRSLTSDNSDITGTTRKVGSSNSSDQARTVSL